MNKPTLYAIGAALCCCLVLQVFASPPDDWRRFTAHQQKKSVYLFWETNAEYQSKDFLVQHSLGGVAWTNVGTIPANGHSGVVSAYKFIHDQPTEGLNHYRIVLLDENGRASFSKVLLVDVHLQEAVQIFPNPVLNGQLQVSLAKEEDVIVFSRNGRAVFQKHCPAGRTTLQLGELRAGLYQLRAGDEVRQFFIR